MCGLAACAGSRRAGQFLSDAVKRLQYRGYDSWGILTTDKAFRKNRTYQNRCTVRIPEDNNNYVQSGTYGLAHTRWASQGKVSTQNCHPIAGGKSPFNPTCYVIHNGNIENYQELRKELEEGGYTFETETDTEVLAHAFDRSWFSLNSYEKFLARVKGNYAIAIISKKYPGKLFASCRGLPLLVSICGKFVASDQAAFQGYCKHYIKLPEDKLFFLENGALSNACLKPGNLDLIVGSTAYVVVKNKSYAREDKHAMWAEIKEQPALIKQKLNVPTLFRYLHLFGCGSSWHAALLGQLYFEKIAGRHTEVSYASHLQDRQINQQQEYLALTQSGETADVIAAMKYINGYFLYNKVKAKCLTNNINSSCITYSDKSYDIKAGPEIGVAATKSFTQQCIWLLRCAINNSLNPISKDSYEKQIAATSEAMQQIVNNSNKESTDQLWEEINKFENVLFLGRGLNYPIALEGALKLKEVSYIHAEGLHAAEIKHGPLAIIGPNTASIFIVGSDDKEINKVLMNMREVRARGGKVFCVCNDSDRNVIKNDSDYQITVPFVNNIYLQPLLFNVVLQILAYKVAILRNLDPDHPRALAKSICVE